MGLSRKLSLVTGVQCGVSYPAARRQRSVRAFGSMRSRRQCILAKGTPVIKENSAFNLKTIDVLRCSKLKGTTAFGVQSPRLKSVRHGARSATPPADDCVPGSALPHVGAFGGNTANAGQTLDPILKDPKRRSRPAPLPRSPVALDLHGIGRAHDIRRSPRVLDRLRVKEGERLTHRLYGNQFHLIWRGEFTADALRDNQATKAQPRRLMHSRRELRQCAHFP